MNRADFQALAKIRVSEARVLLKNGAYPGAYYLSGYALECALKACIARKTKKFDFPDKRIIECYTHDLNALVRLADLVVEHRLETKKVQQFETNWAVAKDWNEASRYRTDISREQARDLFTAVVARNGGILKWLKNRW